MADAKNTNRCSKCHVEQPLSEFYARKGRPAGYDSWCKSCIRESRGSKKRIASQDVFGPEHTRICTQCRTEKPIGAFSISASHRRGIYPQCKECCSRRLREYNKTEIGIAARKMANSTGKRRAQLYLHNRSERAKDNRRKYQSEHKDLYSAARKRYYEKFPEKKKAHCALNRAIKMGKIPRAKTQLCKCGKPAAAWHHHAGYDDLHLLDVIPVCRDCHGEEHAKYKLTEIARMEGIPIQELRNGCRSQNDSTAAH